MTQEVPSREWHGTHREWLYGPHGFRWKGADIVGINVLPLAMEIRALLRQAGHLSLMPEADIGEAGGYTNSYSFSGAAFSLIFARAATSWHDFTHSNASDEPEAEIDAKLERLRIYNEIPLRGAVLQGGYQATAPLLGSSREAVQGMALGALLEMWGHTCKKRQAAARGFDGGHTGASIQAAQQPVGDHWPRRARE